MDFMVDISLGEVGCQLRFKWQNKTLYVRDCHDSKERDHGIFAVDGDDQTSDVTVLFVNGHVHLITEQNKVCFVPGFDVDFGDPVLNVSKYAAKFWMRAEDVKFDLKITFSEKYELLNSLVSSSYTSNASGVLVTPFIEGESSKDISQARIPITSCAWMWIAIAQILIFVILVIFGLVYYMLVIRPKRMRPVKFNYVDGSMDEVDSDRMFQKALDGAPYFEGPGGVLREPKNKVEEAKMEDIQAEKATVPPEREGALHEKHFSNEMDVVVSLESKSNRKGKSVPEVPAKVKGYVPKKDVLAQMQSKGYVVPKPTAINCQADFVQTPAPVGGKPAKKRPKKEK